LHACWQHLFHSGWRPGKPRQASRPMSQYVAVWRTNARTSGFGLKFWHLDFVRGLKIPTFALRHCGSGQKTHVLPPKTGGIGVAGIFSDSRGARESHQGSYENQRPSYRILFRHFAEDRLAGFACGESPRSVCTKCRSGGHEKDIHGSMHRRHRRRVKKPRGIVLPDRRTHHRQRHRGTRPGTHLGQARRRALARLSSRRRGCLLCNKQEDLCPRKERPGREAGRAKNRSGTRGTEKTADRCRRHRRTSPSSRTPSAASASTPASASRR
jgi:hypothetical protein